jgi:hypothetical protein
MGKDYLWFLLPQLWAWRHVPNFQPSTWHHGLIPQPSIYNNQHLHLKTGKSQLPPSFNPRPWNRSNRGLGGAPGSGERVCYFASCPFFLASSITDAIAKRYPVGRGVTWLFCWDGKNNGILSKCEKENKLSRTLEMSMCLCGWTKKKIGVTGEYRLMSQPRGQCSGKCLKVRPRNTPELSRTAEWGLCEFKSNKRKLDLRLARDCEELVCSRELFLVHELDRRGRLSRSIAAISAASHHGFAQKDVR